MHKVTISLRWKKIQNNICMIPFRFQTMFLPFKLLPSHWTHWTQQNYHGCWLHNSDTLRIIFLLFWHKFKNTVYPKKKLKFISSTENLFSHLGPKLLPLHNMASCQCGSFDAPLNIRGFFGICHFLIFKTDRNSCGAANVLLTH